MWVYEFDENILDTHWRPYVATLEFRMLRSLREVMFLGWATFIRIELYMTLQLFNPSLFLKSLKYSSGSK